MCYYVFIENKKKQVTDETPISSMTILNDTFTIIKTFSAQKNITFSSNVILADVSDLVNRLSVKKSN